MSTYSFDQKQANEAEWFTRLMDRKARVTTSQSGIIYIFNLIRDILRVTHIRSKVS